METFEDQAFVLAETVGQALKQSELMLATAESCTGGWVAQAVTAVPGSSAWFEGGFVTYSNEAKQQMLGVSLTTLEEFGAVSEPVVVQMAEGVLQRTRADLAIAISGIAGPAGGSQDKPVGTVWVAWSAAGRQTLTKCFEFSGDRRQIRQRAVLAALMGIMDRLRN
ncbi:nicotinamide-nucleotide amidase [Zooshikella marina]|uniref:Nicotinamide-nucleotide amidase n=1 Tax=Zooshikella ganghwensis TaxID=202772 RepID=A0A4P9VSL5_9GAMM|nr:nicotinamide-nucleotide amidase [Zooshikella ganghwensis]MBU2705810.1 nicotinamide-nucleotide amidase [Zooshikella ganghwensis]RDH45000.1 nicotinamide-nucleotide amidase [Zooshikella ganghwensis]